MVDLAEIQAAYYMIAATGVLVAALYYVMNMRATQRNMKQTLETRRIGLIDNITNRLVEKETMNDFLELMNYEWKDYDDFEHKYGSDNAVDSAAKRFRLWITYNSIGAMLRKGLVDADDVYDLGTQGCFFLWNKYKEIIVENRRRFNGLDYLKDFEFLSDEMLRVKIKRDPSFKMPETFYKYIPENRN